MVGVAYQVIRVPGVKGAGYQDSRVSGKRTEGVR